ncbi:MAG: HAD family hydrolase [Gemmatimonadales bacterium]|nr:MAG: HAD family hydrolase [Gemmatimonadales bacterium]
MRRARKPSTRKDAGAPSTEAPASPPAGRERIPSDRARRVRLVVLDVDGVLTDAGVYMGTDDEGRAMELKRFDIQDGLGIRFLMDAGIDVAIVSGRVSEATSRRAAELGVEACHQVPGAHKLPVVRTLMEERGLVWEEVAMMGDDLPDLPVLRRVGLPVAVGNAVPEVRAEVIWTTRRDGGHGAVREFVRTLLQSRGEWQARVDAYCAARDDETASREIT